MPNSFFQFKKFRIDQIDSGMKVTTDGCLFGAWVAHEISSSSPKTILDIGTGTGLLALMLAQKNQQSKITALEINNDAFLQAQKNFNNSPWASNIKLTNKALQDFQSQEKFDVIICNPPFFKDNLKGPSQNKNQALHADTLSLQDCLKGVLDYLETNGSAFILYPEFEMNQFLELAKEKKLFSEKIVTVRNSKDKSVFRKMVKLRFQPCSPSQEDFNIRDENHLYTEEFQSLISDYYL